MTDEYVAPAIRPEQILTGTIKQTTFNESRIFPGTVRDVTVFIPSQYDGKTPACVYVKTDGFNPLDKTMLETMIVTREMPVTIGVFVRPGTVPAPRPGTLGRRNRCFEYVGLGDAEMNTLYAFSGDKIWKRRVRVHALGTFSEWTPVKGTPL